MEIKATGKLSLEAIKTIVRMNMFISNNPKRRMILCTVLFAIIAVFSVLEIIIWGFDRSNVVVLSVTALVCFFEFFMYFWLPKIKYNAMKDFKDGVNEYTFCDNGFFVSATVKGYSGKSEVDYSGIIKVTETNKYLFLHNNRKQVYVVDKSTVCGGDLEEKLKAVVGKKYRFCNI